MSSCVGSKLRDEISSTLNHLLRVLWVAEQQINANMWDVWMGYFGSSLLRETIAHPFG